jgi:TolB protein
MSTERREPDLSEQQVNRLLRSYLREEWHEDANRVASSVLDELDTTPQRRSRWAAWRSSVMNNNIVRVGLAAAAVVVVAIIAINLLPGSALPGSGIGPQGRIVFSSDRDGPMSIYAMDVGTGEVSRLTSHDGFADVPRWSPDATRIVFSADWVEPDPAACPSPCPFQDVWIMDPDGSRAERLSLGDTGEVPQSWSPDGATLLIDRFDDDGNLQVVALDAADPATSRALTSGPPNGLADWSPDGATVVFLSLRNGDEELYLMGPDGTDQRNLTRSPESDENLPRWSPDGRRIVFVSQRDGNREVYVMDADGRNLVRLTDSPGNDWFPEWSPDGRHIVFASSRDGDEELFVMAEDGTDLRQLTFNGAVEGKPDWTD